MSNSNITISAISEELEFKFGIPTGSICVIAWAFAQMTDAYILKENWDLLSFSKPPGGNLLLSIVAKFCFDLIIGIIGLIRIFVNNTIVCQALAISVEGCITFGEYYTNPFLFHYNLLIRLFL